jgi:agmatinase
MDVSVAPGTGAPEVGGLYPREVLGILRRLAGLDFAGIDLVEVNPLFDAANMTSILAANLVFEFITLLAIRKRDQHA